MTLMLLTGFQNEGKTLALTRFVFSDFLKGREIFCNTNFKFKHTIINKDFLLNMVEKGISLKNITWALDEFWLWADARKLSTMLSYFYLQSSKDNANIIMTAQTDRQIDVRLRENLHYWGECERRVLWNGKLRRLPKNYWDKRLDIPKELQDKIFIVVRMHRPVSRISGHLSYSEFELVKTYHIYGKIFYNLYNTESKIKIT